MQSSLTSALSSGPDNSNGTEPGRHSCSTEALLQRSLKVVTSSHQEEAWEVRDRRTLCRAGPTSNVFLQRVEIKQASKYNHYSRLQWKESKIQTSPQFSSCSNEHVTLPFQRWFAITVQCAATTALQRLAQRRRPGPCDRIPLFTPRWAPAAEAEPGVLVWLSRPSRWLLRGEARCAAGFCRPECDRKSLSQFSVLQLAFWGLFFLIFFFTKAHPHYKWKPTSLAFLVPPSASPGGQQPLSWADGGASTVKVSFAITGQASSFMTEPKLQLQGFNANP